MFSKKFLTLISIYSMSISTYAAIVDPQFSGEWYDKITSTETDNCLSQSWQYNEKSTSKETLLAELMKDRSVIANCEWQTPVLDTYTNTTPDDFPALSEYEDFIRKNPNAPQPELWKSACVSKEGEVYDEVYAEIRPIYHCPKGSRVIMRNFRVFCSTTPDVCMGDVVGRDLKIRPPLDKLGHVGLATVFKNENSRNTTGNYVLEVLWEDPKIINIHTLESFANKVAGKFWGAVYGLPEVPSLNFDKAYYIYLAGINQQKFDPLYTLTSKWVEGAYLKQPIYDGYTNTFIDQLQYVRAKFRCDTFIYYCFLKASIKIDADKMFPYLLYQKFLHKRDDIVLPKKAQLTPYAGEKEIVDTLKLPINGPNLEKIETNMKRYLNNPNYSRQQKLMTLSNQLKTFTTFEQYSYTLDMIASLKPIELIPFLINEYENESSIEKKRNIVSALTSAVHSKDLNDVRKKWITDAQKLMVTILQTEISPKLLRQTIFDALSVLPANTENYLIIENAGIRLQSMPNNHFGYDDKYLSLAAMAFSNKSIQMWAIPRLLSKSMKEAERHSFISQLIFIIKQLSPTDINDKVKLMLSKYLGTQSALSEGVSNYDWSYAMATLNSNNDKDKNKTLLIQVLAEKNSLIQAEMIGNIKDDVLLAIPLEMRNALIEKFNPASLGTKYFHGMITYTLASSRLKHSLDPKK